MLVRSKINKNVLKAEQELKESVWSVRVWNLGQTRESTVCGEQPKEPPGRRQWKWQFGQRNDLKIWSFGVTFIDGHCDGIPASM